MASMRNGSGDEWFCWFGEPGAAPEERALAIGDTTFVIWRAAGDSRWQTGAADLPDGAAWLLALLVDHDSGSYVACADREAVAAIHAGGPLTAGLVRRLDPERGAEAALAEARRDGASDGLTASRRAATAAATRRCRRVRRILLSSLALLAVVPVPAAGQTTLRSVPEAAGGPSAWDGGNRFVAARWQGDGHELHVLGTPSPAPLATLEPVPGRGGRESVSVAASARWIVVRRARERYDRQGPLEAIAADVVVAGWSGGVRTIDACTAPRAEIRSTPVAIDGDVMAWSDTGCVQRAEVVVLDAAGGARTSLPVPEDPAVGAEPLVDSVWVRGRWVAAAVSSWNRRLKDLGPVVYVFDRLSGEVRLRADPGKVQAGTLAGDGTLIACSATGRLVRFSAAVPQGEDLPVGLACRGGVAERAGQVAFLSPAPPVPGLVYGEDLHAAPVDGTAPPRLLLERPASLVGFDGRRAAVLIHSDCRGRQGFGIAGDPQAPAAPPHTCPLEIGAQPLRVRPGRRPRLRVSCPLGCVFTVFVAVPGRVVTYRHRARMEPGERYVTLPRRRLRAWGRHRFAEVSVDMSTRCCVRTVKRRVRLDVRR